MCSASAAVFETNVPNRPEWSASARKTRSSSVNSKREGYAARTLYVAQRNCRKIGAYTAGSAGSPRKERSENGNPLRTHSFVTSTAKPSSVL